MLKLARRFAGRFVDGAEIWALGALSLASWRRRRRLARRERERPSDPGRWFTPAEAHVVAALASLIVPSDETGPGAKEAGVTESLDLLLAQSPARQRLYRSGLLACDEWAHRRHGRSFVELAADKQRQLLDWADPAPPGSKIPSSLAHKVWRKAASVYRKWRCPLVELFPDLARDVMGAFYTHPIAWDWLGYDGPPMPAGYPDLRERTVSPTGARSVGHPS